MISSTRTGGRGRGRGRGRRGRGNRPPKTEWKRPQRPQETETERERRLRNEDILAKKNEQKEKQKQADEFWKDTEFEMVATFKITEKSHDGYCSDPGDTESVTTTTKKIVPIPYMLTSEDIAIGYKIVSYRVLGWLAECERDTMSKACYCHEPNVECVKAKIRRKTNLLELINEFNVQTTESQG